MNEYRCVWCNRTGHQSDECKDLAELQRRPNWQDVGARTEPKPEPLPEVNEDDPS